MRPPREKSGESGQDLRNAYIQKLGIPYSLLSKCNAKSAERSERKISPMSHCLWEISAITLHKV